MKNLKSIIESVLFIHGEPLALKKIAEVCETGEEEVKNSLQELRQDYRTRDGGLMILEKDKKYQLGTHPDNSSFIEKMAKSEFQEELSRAAMETMAIISYRGPISRVDIEYLRGVNSSFTLRTLVMRGLAERKENPKDARSFLYAPSMDFLKHLGAGRLEDLPQYEEFNKKEIKIAEDEEPSSD